MKYTGMAAKLQRKLDEYDEKRLKEFSDKKPGKEPHKAPYKRLP